MITILRISGDYAHRWYKCLHFSALGFSFELYQNTFDIRNTFIFKLSVWGFIKSCPLSLLGWGVGGYVKMLYHLSLKTVISNQNTNQSWMYISSIRKPNITSKHPKIVWTDVIFKLTRTYCYSWKYNTPVLCFDLNMSLCM